jgi:hypothetical protein
VALGILRRDGGVAAHDLLSVDLGRNGDVLANGKAKDILNMGETEAVAGYDALRIRRCHGMQWCVETYMAVLGDFWIFSMRGNSL